MPDEDRDLTIKRFEKLYEIATRDQRLQMRRFEHIEKKAWRHFALLAFVLGTLTVGIPTFVKAFRAASELWKVGLGVAYIGMIAAALVGVWFLASALRYRNLKVESFTQDTIDDFQEFGYLDELLSRSKGLAAAGSWNRDVVEDKLRKARWGYRFTVLSFTFGAATILLLLCIEWQTLEAILP